MLVTARVSASRGRLVAVPSFKRHYCCTLRGQGPSASRMISVQSPPQLDRSKRRQFAREMNFVPWWQDEFLRSRIVALGWTLMIAPAVFAVASRWFDPIHPIDVRDSAPALISMAGIGVVLLVVERYLRPRRHHAQVLLVEMPDRAPYYFSICECRWFGGVHHDAATPF